MHTLTTPAPTDVRVSDTLTVTAWRTPIDHIGHDHRSPYAERFVLPIIGPTCLWLLRCLAYGFDTNPDTLTVSRGSLGRQLGLNRDNAGIGRHSPLSRAFDRLTHFGYATQPAPDVLNVRVACPWLDAGQVARLPDAHRAEHGAWIDAFNTANPDDAELRDHAAHVATMRRRGATPELIDAALHAWHATPAVIDALTRDPYAR